MVWSLDLMVVAYQDFSWYFVTEKRTHRCMFAYTHLPVLLDRN